uniref:Glucose-6-phosphate 1-epimerase n=1 Tax=Compsopogon caeruleus TaxID=31354 RepID=A0A7S1T7R6_9RHOD|mmetsp:Transcript_12076/g.24592  ORF Transcript_12076/g.24592 Transcript_12076/m.24592 type:complete len:160 (+) Transcript_12076:474-953(+)
MWTLVSCTQDAEGQTLVELTLGSDAPTVPDVWNHPYSLSIKFTVGTSLSIQLTTRNEGNSPFRLSQALHTYLHCEDIHALQIEGLDGKEFIDKVDEGQKRRQQGFLTIDREIDRVYENISGPVMVKDLPRAKSVVVESSGSQTVIIWNPWREKCVAAKD